MAVDLTSLGGHRLPVRRYDGFLHITSDVIVYETSPLGASATQSASWTREVSRSETANAVDAQTASLAGEATHGDYTSLGAHRLPTRRYGSFIHDPGAVRAESQVLRDTQSATGVQGVVLDEIVSAVDAVLAQSAIPDSVVETVTAVDTIDTALSRVGAIVSTVGPMGMPRQRWVDFIHPAGVEETVSFLDSQDAALPGEVVDFVHEIAIAVDIIVIGTVTQVDVVDALALNDFSTTGNIFNGAMDESAPIVDVTTGELQALEATVNEVNALVDIIVISSSLKNTTVFEFSNLFDIPGIAGELFEHVAEVANLSSGVFDVSGSFTPGVNIDGARTVFVEEEVRELEVMA